ncbi:MAG: 50S ribosome-binding GTPase [Deltaproteobacteria bacterium]|nr:50S ribosome-binding GTPase [Deltaproteobacteria bacterium]
MDVLEAEFVAGATVLGQLPAPTFAEVAFAGRSNVGKSSLINSLLRRKKLVRTSSAPGCTRAINIFRVRLRTDDNEAHLDLVDLPGYGYAQRSKAASRTMTGNCSSSSKASASRRFWSPPRSTSCPRTSESQRSRSSSGKSVSG